MFLIAPDSFASCLRQIQQNITKVSFSSQCQKFYNILNEKCFFVYGTSAFSYLIEWVGWKFH
eukprot:Pgem_evm1s10860